MTSLFDGAQEVALVTGASSGFGAAITRRLARRGTGVIAIARRGDRLADLVDALGDDLVWPVEADVRDHAAVAQALENVPASFSEIGILVNNAGLALGMNPAFSADLADWDQMIETNCSALVHVTRLVLPQMVERGRGIIINIGSTAGNYPYPGGNVYGATKAFVHQFSLNLRSDLHGSGVKVTSIEPGMCSGTEFARVRFGGDVAKATELYRGMDPLDAEDIAGAIEWVIDQPCHVNVNRLELMPVAQSFGFFQISRTE